MSQPKFEIIEHSATPSLMDSQFFNSGEYRICTIELEDGRDHTTCLYKREVFLRSEPTELWFWEPFRIRVEYECMLPTIPESSCGVGCALTSAETKEHVMYFNTNRPHSDEELKRYHEAKFRQFRGRRGVVCGTVHRLQVKPSNYILTVAIVSNQPGDPDIYEIHYLRYPIRVVELQGVSSEVLPKCLLHAWPARNAGLTNDAAGRTRSRCAPSAVGRQLG